MCMIAAVILFICMHLLFACMCKLCDNHNLVHLVLICVLLALIISIGFFFNSCHDMIYGEDKRWNSWVFLLFSSLQSGFIQLLLLPFKKEKEDKTKNEIDICPIQEGRNVLIENPEKLGIILVLAFPSAGLGVLSTFFPLVFALTGIIEVALFLWKVLLYLEKKKKKRKIT